MYYFDNAATTQPDKRALEFAKRYLYDVFGNPSSLHDQGMLANKAIEYARKKIADAINGSIYDIYFTPTASMSNSLFLMTYCRQMRREHGKNHIITTSIEHPSVLNTCKYLETDGFRVTYLPVDKQGFIDMECLKKSISDDTILISVIAVNNEIGTIQPIKEISDIAWNMHVPLHVDATQWLGKDRIDVDHMGISFMTASAHKIHGVRGAALLYAKDIGEWMDPLVYGGHQEGGIVAGTENTYAISVFGEAVKIEYANLHFNRKYIGRKQKYIVDRLMELPDSFINGADISEQSDARIVNNINIRFNGVNGQKLQNLLSEKGICISTGSACSSGSRKPSHVLKAIGLSDEEASNSIRISLSADNTLDECEYLVNWIKYYVDLLRNMG